jgi:tRNA pseudouridine55 synthase
MPNGIVIIDKPSGWTSMDVCAKLRGILHERRVGHAGTLDPMATGVLPVFVGRATRAVSFAESGKKEYIATLRLGLATDTQDVTGTAVFSAPVTVTRRDLEAVLPRFTGDILQVPPMYSAVKVNGQKLCNLARRGATVERKPRPVTIYALEILERAGAADYTLRCVCSKGTYIRTLCHDIGQVLGCGGCLSSLRRTLAAGFSIDRAVTLEDVQREGEALLLPLDAYFAEYPAYTAASPKQEARCRCGNPLDGCGIPDGTYRVYGVDGTFLCLSRAKGGTLTSVKNFFGT